MRCATCTRHLRTPHQDPCIVSPESEPQSSSSGNPCLLCVRGADGCVPRAQAYLARDARDLYNDANVRDLPVTTWLDVAAGPPINRSLAPMRPYIRCCGLKEGADMIDFAKVQRGSRNSCHSRLPSNA